MHKQFVRKLPVYLQSEAQKQFFAATFDQLFNPAEVESMEGFIGRKSGGIFDTVNDIYIDEPTKGRRAYQLEPIAYSVDSTSLQDDNHVFYEDLINRIRFYGGNVSNHDRLFSDIYYSFAPPIDIDKFVNYRNYVWIQNAIPPVFIRETNNNVALLDQLINERILGAKYFNTSDPSTYELDDPLRNVGLSPSGFEFTSGIRVVFEGSTEFPEVYHVENVGSQIRFVRPITTQAISPNTIPLPWDTAFTEEWDSFPWDGQSILIEPPQKDHITIERGACNGNVWSRTNRWYHIEAINRVQAVGQVISVSLINEGIGYILGDTIPIIGDGIDGMIEVTGVDGLGRITAYTISNRGQGYSFATVNQTGNIPLDVARPWDRNPVTPESLWDGVYGWDQLASSSGTNAVFEIELASAIDRRDRGERPILEYRRSLELYNHGTKHLGEVDVAIKSNSFTNIIGQSNYVADGVDLQDGMLLIFLEPAAIPSFIPWDVIGDDPDPLTSPNPPGGYWDTYSWDVQGLPGSISRFVWQVSGVGTSIVLERYNLDTQMVDLTTPPADEGDSVLVRFGTEFAGYPFYMKDLPEFGFRWILGESRLFPNTQPLFQLYDYRGIPLDDTLEFPFSTFEGNEIFSYKKFNPNESLNTNEFAQFDNVLGFDIVRKNLGQVGDILFENDLETERTQFAPTMVTQKEIPGYYFFREFEYDNYCNILEDDRGDKISELLTNWVASTEDEKQRVIDQFLTSTDTQTDFILSAVPFNGDVYVRVNGRKLGDDEYEYDADRNAVRLFLSSELNELGVLIKTFTPPPVQTIVELFAYTHQSITDNEFGFFEIPRGLANNPNNQEIVENSWNDFINHFVSIIEQQTPFFGRAFGVENNYRDSLKDNSKGRFILQNQSPLIKAMLATSGEELDVIESMRLSAREYTRYKNKFLNIGAQLINEGYTPFNAGDNIPVNQWVDEAIRRIIRAREFPTAFEDTHMLAWSNVYEEEQLTGNSIETLLTVTGFVDLEDKRNAIYIYIDGNLLTAGRDYEVVNLNPIQIEFTSPPLVGNNILVRLYENSAPAHIPATPAKLGITLPSVPRVVLDETYVEPVLMIIGHDNSTTPMFGDYDFVSKVFEDYRDEMLLEFETRIYNGIIEKFRNDYDPALRLEDIEPSATRTTRWDRREYETILRRSFFKWATANRVDFRTNESFDINDDWTWNYNTTISPDGNLLPGYWRGIFNSYYGSQTPHLTPWEMLGCGCKPLWWDSEYGPGPWPSSHILWQHIEDGYIAAGFRQGYDARFARHGFYSYRLSRIEKLSDGFGYVAGEEIELTGAGTPSASTQFGGYIKLRVDRVGPLGQLLEYTVVDRGGLDPNEELSPMTLHSKGANFRLFITRYFPIQLDGSLALSVQSAIDNTFLMSPPTPEQASEIWNFGDFGPAEYAWRTSESYPFAVAETLFLTSPATFGEKFFNPENFLLAPANETQVISLRDNIFKRIGNSTLTVHGEVRNGVPILNTGYQVWITSRLKMLRLSIEREFGDKIRSLDVKLGHKVAGFTSADSLRVFVEGVSVTSQATNLLVPVENVDVRLFTGASVREYFYGGVLLQATETGGYKVFGYDVLAGRFNYFARRQSPQDRNINIAGQPEPFTSYESGRRYRDGVVVRLNGLFYRCIVEHEATKFIAENWQRLSSLPVVGGINVTYKPHSSGRVLTIDYGHEFDSPQEVFDFLIGYGQYLEARGWKFENVNPDSGELENWLTSGKEFLFWVATNWAAGNSISLSPSANEVNLEVSEGYPASVEKISNGVYSILDRYGMSIDPINTKVFRDGRNIRVVPTINDQEVYAIRVSTEETESVVTFDNTTQFDDVLYDPLLGSRQERLYINGRRTTGWTGKLEASGYIITENGLIQNFENLVDSVRDYHNTETTLDNKQIEATARHLVGYEEREHLNNLQIFDDAQYQFYQGAIRQKGTTQNIKKLERSRIVTDLEDELRVYEEWALRAGEFGGVASQQITEFLIRANAIKVDPQLVELDYPPTGGKGTIQRIDIVGASEVWSTPPVIYIQRHSDDLYTINATASATIDGNGLLTAITVTTGGEYSITPQIAVGNQVPTEVSDRAVARLEFEITEDTPGDDIITIDIDDHELWITKPSAGATDIPDSIWPTTKYVNKNVPSAGYVHLDDITHTIFDIRNLQSLWDQPSPPTVTAGLIWTAKAENNDWAVYEMVSGPQLVRQLDPSDEDVITEYYRLVGFTISSPGVNYIVGEEFTLTAGTGSVLVNPVRVRVLSVDNITGGVITLEIVDGGLYITPPDITEELFFGISGAGISDLEFETLTYEPGVVFFNGLLPSAAASGVRYLRNKVMIGQIVYDYEQVAGQLYRLSIDGEPIEDSTFNEADEVADVPSAVFVNLRFHNVAELIAAGVSLNTIYWLDDVDGHWEVRKIINSSEVLHRKEELLIDTSLFKGAFIYDATSKDTIHILPVYDPFKGIFPGMAEANIKYRSNRDPARYTTAEDERLIKTVNAPGTITVGDLWWDTNTCAYIWYEQPVSKLDDPFTADRARDRYRRDNWGSLFPGSQVDVYEWTRSPTPPSEYDGVGTVRNNTDYMEVVEWDPFIEDLRTFYYFWVKGVPTAPGIRTRTLSASEVSRILRNPRGQLYRWYCPVSQKGFIFSGVEGVFTDSDNIFQINFRRSRTNEFHKLSILYPSTNYGLDEEFTIGNGIVIRVTEVGMNGALKRFLVLDYGPAPAENTGVLVEPASGARFELSIEKNTKKIKKHVEWELGRENDNDYLVKDSIWDKMVDSLVGYTEPVPIGASTIDAGFPLLNNFNNALPIVGGATTGYLPVPDPTLNKLNRYGIRRRPLQSMFVDRKKALRVFVQVVNELMAEVRLRDEDPFWNLEFPSNNLWEWGDWYAIGYNAQNVIPTRQVATVGNLSDITDPFPGEIVKINETRASYYAYNPTTELFDLIAKQSSSLVLKDEIYTHERNIPDSLELRAILYSLKNRVFTNVRQGFNNRIFFSLLHYVFQEQEDLDWAFKTTFIVVEQTGRQITTDRVFQIEPADSVFAYMMENKPYHTKIRDYRVTRTVEVDDLTGTATELAQNMSIRFLFDRFRCSLSIPEIRMAKSAARNNPGYDGYHFLDNNTTEIRLGAAGRLAVQQTDLLGDILLIRSDNSTDYTPVDAFWDLEPWDSSIWDGAGATTPEELIAVAEINRRIHAEFRCYFEGLNIINPPLIGVTETQSWDSLPWDVIAWDSNDDDDSIGVLDGWDDIDFNEIDPVDTFIGTGLQKEFSLTTTAPTYFLFVQVFDTNGNIKPVTLNMDYFFIGGRVVFINAPMAGHEVRVYTYIEAGDFMNPQVHAGITEEMVPLDPRENLVIIADTVDDPVTPTVSHSFRIHYDTQRTVTFLRNTASAMTTLSSQIGYDDHTIAVVDVTALEEQPTTYENPNVAWICSERIVFRGVDYANNLLLGVQRGTRGTSVALHASGCKVFAGGESHEIPNPQQFWVTPGVTNVFSGTDGVWQDNSDGTAVFLESNNPGVVATQTEDDYNGGPGNGTFIGGNGYTVGDLITLANGAVIEVFTIDGTGTVTEFEAITGAFGFASITYFQSGVDPIGGEGFSLTLPEDSTNTDFVNNVDAGDALRVANTIARGSYNVQGFIPVGSIVGVAITNPGTGYNIGDPVILTTAGAARVAVVDSNGGVLALTVTDRAAGLAQGNTFFLSPSFGNGEFAAEAVVDRQGLIVTQPSPKYTGGGRVIVVVGATWSIDTPNPGGLLASTTAAAQFIQAQQGDALPCCPAFIAQWTTIDD